MNRSDTTQQISDAFNQLKRAMHVYATEHLSDTGVSPAQLGLLRSIHCSQPVSSKELAANVQLTPGAVSQLLDGLLQSGCVSRSIDETDRRISYLSVTRQGKTVLERYNKQREYILSQALTELPDSDLQSYVRVQQALIDWLDSQTTKQ